MIRAVQLTSAIGRRCAALLGLAVLVCLLALPAIAWGGETAPGSTETLALSATYPRVVDEPFTITAEGTADGLHRLFVYGEAEGTCTAWPYEETTQKEAVWLSSPEGEPLSAGRFSKTYTATRQAAGDYDVCAYLDATPFALRDDFESACLPIPNGISDCYIASVSPAEILSSEEEAKIYNEEVEAERKHRAEAEQAARHANEETAARRAKEESERRQAAEEAERKARQAELKRCVVPRLRRHTLAGVRRLLLEASCRLGRVTIRDHGRGTLTVTSQNPKQGKALPHGTRVSIILESHDDE